MLEKVPGALARLGVRGLDVTITTSAQTDLEAFALLEAFGMPFTKENADQVLDAEGNWTPEGVKETFYELWGLG